MSTRSASGREIVLESGDYRARIVTVGAGLAGLSLAGHDLVIPHSVEEIPAGHLGKMLLPWPNRIADSTYEWNGARYEVDRTERSTGAALHGLMSWVEWDIVHADQDSATLGAFLAPRKGYPWALETWVTYALNADSGLSVSVHTKNIGTQAAPYGVSSHPYVTLNGAPNDSYELSIPATSILEVDEKLTPVGKRPVADMGRDFTRPRILGDLTIDHAFTDLPEGEWTVTIRDPESGMSVALSSDAKWVQVYTAEVLDREGIAVEPMTCPPNAFNSHEDLIVLEPGHSHTLTFSIRGSLS